MSRTSLSGAASARVSVPTDSPERSTLTRSAISPISSTRCEMNRVVMPPARRRSIAVNRRSLVATSSAEVASSRISTLGSRSSTRAIVHAWRTDSGSSPAGVSRSRSVPSNSANIACARARLPASGRPLPWACWTSYCATFIMASTVFGTTLTTFASSTSFSTPTVGMPREAALSISEL